MIIIAAAWLSKKINSPWLAASLGLILIGLAIYGLAEGDMPTIIAIAIIVVGLINLARLLPHVEEPAEEEPAKAEAPEVA